MRREVWITLGILNVSFLRMWFSTAGVISMISKAATRPGLSHRGSSACEITAISDTESCARICSCASVGKASMMRSTVRAAPVVCSVARTKWPVSAG